MKTKKILGFLALIIGIAMICISNYITTQIKEGKLKIARAQKQVDKGSGLFNANPITKEIGKGVTGGAQKKIDAGRQMVANYEVIAHRLQVGGIIIAIVGAGLVILGFTGKEKKRR